MSLRSLTTGARALGLLACVLGGAYGPLARAADQAAPVVITDVEHWQHPVKAVLQKYKVKLIRVELTKDRKYPIFHVACPYDPQSSATADFFTPLLYDILRANGKWPYELICEDDKVGFDVKWDAGKKAMSEDLIEAD